MDVWEEGGECLKGTNILRRSGGCKKRTVHIQAGDKYVQVDMMWKDSYMIDCIPFSFCFLSILFQFSQLQVIRFMYVAAATFIGWWQIDGFVLIEKRVTKSINDW